MVLLATVPCPKGGAPTCVCRLLPSGKRLHNELERSTMFNGKIHYFYDHFQ